MKISRMANISHNGVGYSCIVGGGAAAVATLMRAYLPESWLDQANDDLGVSLTPLPARRTVIRFTRMCAS